MNEVVVNAGGFRRAPRARLERAVRLTLDAEDVWESEISLTLLDDARIRALNRDHLAHDAPTDVLSFALHEDGEPPLGDIYLGVEQARRQAAEAGVTEVEELVRLAVHGTLHVLGWDHPDPPEERFTSTMWRRQEAIVAEVMKA